MPRSWPGRQVEAIFRSLMQEFAETMRLHRGEITTHRLRLKRRMIARRIDPSIWIATYGGQVQLQAARVFSQSLFQKTLLTHAIPMQITARLQGEKVVFRTAQPRTIGMLSPVKTRIKSVSAQLPFPASHGLAEITLLLPALKQIPPRALRLTPVQKTATLQHGTFKTPRQYRIALLSQPRRCQSFSTVQRHQLPVERKAHPIHRYALELRKKLRQVMAEKAGVSPDAIQINLIFDRIHLDQLQTLVPTDDGNLKTVFRADAKTSQSIKPFYLAIGTTVSGSKKRLQGILPMVDFVKGQEK